MPGPLASQAPGVEPSEQLGKRPVQSAAEGLSRSTEGNSSARSTDSGVRMSGFLDCVSIPVSRMPGVEPT